MRRDEPISTIMATNLVTLCVTDDLVTAEKLFIEHKIKHIPVVRDKEIIGMLSYYDIQTVSSAVLNEDQTSVDSYINNNFSIAQVMDKSITAIPPYTSIKDAAELLTTKGFHALPVVEDSELVGIVTTRDLVKYLVAKL
ncbi:MULTISPECIES: CBS domain-containing protein [Polaribacter]|jgi:CBS domain-containing protein|uniref:CBS domain-containing protein n=2 Tax=Polaribacter TaxID=52959 RepID=A0A176TD92_9FLAO|nr:MULTISPECIES: CBS domain-containing protein [Polaribacter]AUC21086.1 CBS domain-containing protein [Polaribacter sejongensis]MDN3620744.1 CBS domain-containing protein [Polaribacter undariae]OAD45842.1 CBS domain-containing protein [Polaribacter atrinae]QXP64283.1 CBS domain-containing protein [Polaribacter sp. HaHaR_3_91]QXP66786.1 CBS domain-containing protein [Polaribacter sp. AHE13PA]